MWNPAQPSRRSRAAARCPPRTTSGSKSPARAKQYGAVVSLESLAPIPQVDFSMSEQGSGRFLR